MNRYINANWLESEFNETNEVSFFYLNADSRETFEELKKIVKQAPSIDIVFCQECKFEWTQKCPWHHMGLIHDESDYCSGGIRRTDDE